MGVVNLNSKKESRRMDLLNTATIMESQNSYPLEFFNFYSYGAAQNSNHLGWLNSFTVSPTSLPRTYPLDFFKSYNHGAAQNSYHLGMSNSCTVSPTSLPRNNAVPK